MASRPETIEKMHMARDRGLSIEKIAAKMIRELIEGYNWDSKRGKKIQIE